ncbi:YdeI/OmpD-associated family protein [Streptomyces sp. NPDC003327]
MGSVEEPEPGAGPERVEGLEPVEGLAVMAFADGRELEAWLAEHHGDTPGIWLLLARKGADLPSPTADEILDGTLIYGWITGKRKARDERTYLQKITPRRPRSLWSQVNVRQVEALTAAGRMREPGLAEVRAARADGRWESAYPAQKDATVPDDLAAALAADPAAAKAFDALGKTDRYLIILTLWQARTPKTRSARLERALAALRAGAA